MSCAQCGAPGSEARCDELFQELLALDHGRRPPWGPLHAVAVACFFLQHPGHQRAPRELGPSIAVLGAYVRGGQAAVDALTSRLRSGQGTGLHPAVPVRPAVFGTTIVDVAVDGTFPAEGYPERVSTWAADTAAAWLER